MTIMDKLLIISMSTNAVFWLFGFGVGYIIWKE